MGSAIKRKLHQPIGNSLAIPEMSGRGIVFSLVSIVLPRAHAERNRRFHFHQIGIALVGEYNFLACGVDD